MVSRCLVLASSASLPFVIAMIAASAAQAQDAIPAPTILGWTLDSVRAGVRYAPDYLGSDDYGAGFTGAVVLSRRDATPQPSGAPDDGVSLGLLGKGPLTAGPRLGWGDASFTRKYFEVTPLEASRSPLGVQAFSPSGASWSPGAIVSAEYRVNPRWSLESVGSYRRLTGDAADSPIVADLGSRDQFSVSLSVRYSLGQ